jgi:hypothetical protein
MGGGIRINKAKNSSERQIDRKQINGQFNDIGRADEKN